MRAVRGDPRIQQALPNILCEVCKSRFPSRNALFRHLHTVCLKGQFHVEPRDPEHRRKQRKRQRRRRAEARQRCRHAKAASGDPECAAECSVGTLVLAANGWEATTPSILSDEGGVVVYGRVHELTEDPQNTTANVFGRPTQIGEETKYEYTCPECSDIVTWVAPAPTWCPEWGSGEPCDARCGRVLHPCSGYWSCRDRVYTVCSSCGQGQRCDYAALGNRRQREQ